MTDRAEGNPFYIEELVSFIAAQGVDPSDAAAIRAVQLPESLHSLVLSRIDTMAEGPRRTLKVASVVGRVFEAPTLPGAYPELGDLDQVVEQLDALRTVDLVTLDREQDRAYLFKHVATQEVAYESLPFAVRSMLHGRIGRYIEESRAATPRATARPPGAPLLAERRRRRASSATWPRRPKRREPRTRTPRRSTTWSG